MHSLWLVWFVLLLEVCPRTAVNRRLWEAGPSPWWGWRTPVCTTVSQTVCIKQMEIRTRNCSALLLEIQRWFVRRSWVVGESRNQNLQVSRAVLVVVVVVLMGSGEAHPKSIHTAEKKSKTVTFLYVKLDQSYFCYVLVMVSIYSNAKLMICSMSRFKTMRRMNQLNHHCQNIIRKVIKIGIHTTFGVIFSEQGNLQTEW